jgi:hypothetical protein
MGTAAMTDDRQHEHAAHVIEVGAIGALDAWTEMEKMWSIFEIRDDEPISLRAIKKPMQTENFVFHAIDYPDVRERQRAFMTLALDLCMQGYNVYIVMNPILPEFRLGGDVRGVGDQHIACRRLILIDVDRSGIHSCPATDTEIQEISSVCDEIMEYLDQNMVNQYHKVMSGNGIHIYIELPDIPNDEATAKTCERLLNGLAKNFNKPTVKVDTAVANASRITKVPGTIARKGSEGPGRPFRMAVVL